MMTLINYRSVVSILLVATLTIVGTAIACGQAERTIDIPTPGPAEPTPAPSPLSLPADDASHNSPIEWWYYNGHLKNDQGDEFSFHYVVFSTFSQITNRSLQYAQMGISDIQIGEHRNHRSSSIPTSKQNDVIDSEEDLLNIDLGNFQLKIDTNGNHSLSSSDQTQHQQLELTLQQGQNVMLHEGIGWMQWPFGWTYYYSYPRMKAEGTLTFDGVKTDVTGEVWFDHQWGDFFVVGKPAGWQWFAMHLDNGDSIMVSEVRGADGEVIAIDGTLTTPDGTQRIFDAEKDNIQIQQLEQWTSPHTNGIYPSKWRIILEEEKLDMILQPVIADQEIPAIPIGNKAAAYWEGRADIFDSNSNQMIGRAYVELSGYVDPDPLRWQTNSR